MPESPQRKRFQIHLSTAIVMMFVAGALIWANVKPNAIPRLVPKQPRFRSGFGWPCEAIRKTSDFEFTGEGPDITFDFKETYYPSYLMIAFNLAAALFILFFVAFLCEWLIRRRARGRERET
jgi:hypothetical protein